MKKHMKKIVFVSISLVAILTMVSVHAADWLWFYFDIPARQGWVTTTADRGDGVIATKTNKGEIIVDAQNIDEVTYYAGGYVYKDTDSKEKEYVYSPNGTIMNLENDDTGYLNYERAFSIGTKMRTKARNHVWKLTKKGVSNGYINYN